MPRLLDLFCKAGGASMGYARAGFEVVGVDIEPQPRYPFEFHQADALTFPLDGFDAIAASPPCQAWSSMRIMADRSARGPVERLELIAPIRERLIASEVLYVIENVPGAPLIDPIRLCGSSFGLGVQRHRHFESNAFLLAPPCAHEAYGLRYPVALGDPRAKGRKNSRSRFIGVYGGTHFAGESALRREAMAIDWMTGPELTQAIPPAFTELIGLQLLNALGLEGVPRAHARGLVGCAKPARGADLLGNS